MIIFRAILSIILTPVTWLANLLTRRKDDVLEWHLNYGPSFVKIHTNHKKQTLADDLLIASYILFLARYFYICDDRQTDVVRSFLLEEVEKSQKPNELTSKLYEAVFQTLSQKEKEATLGLFKTYNRFSPTPPLTFSEDEEPKHSLAKYQFSVFEHPDGNGLGNVFHMSAGSDIILLPLTIGILYEYVVDKLQNKDKKGRLDNSIIGLLKKHSVVDYRSIAGQNESSNEVISNNNLNY